MGLTFQQIQKYEKGTNRLSGSRMMAVCKLLEISPNDLIGYNGAAAAPTELSQGAIRIAHKYDRLDPDQKKAVSAIFTAFLGGEDD